MVSGVVLTTEGKVTTAMDMLLARPMGHRQTAMGTSNSQSAKSSLRCVLELIYLRKMYPNPDIWEKRIL